MKVSVHGGHSGKYCNHAKDNLEEMVKAYLSSGFSWVGITEHVPPVHDAFLYPEEADAGLDAAMMLDRCADYIYECRGLQKKYRDRIHILVALESETCTGYENHMEMLVHRFLPDYIVGSVHHVNDIPFDYSPQEYERALISLGGYEALYCRYFDQQYAMMQQLRPAVLGHFDLIRIYDSDYKKHLGLSEVWRRIERNLDCAAHLQCILDYNLRALDKGVAEPYISEKILHRALQKGLCVVPGDDSHSVSDIGTQIDRGIGLLEEAGFSTDWAVPRKLETVRRQDG